MQKTLVLFLVSILSTTSFVLAGKTEGEDSDYTSTVSRSGTPSTAQERTNLSSLPDDLIGMISSFLLPREQAALSLTSRCCCEGVRTNAQKTHTQLTEKMAQLTKKNKAVLHAIFGRELTTEYIACSQTLVFIDRFKEKSQIYERFYKKLAFLLKNIPISKKRAFVRNAEGLGLLNLPSNIAFDRVQAFLPLSAEQLDILRASIIPEMDDASDDSDDASNDSEYLGLLRELSPEQPDALSRNAAAIFQNIERYDHAKCLASLSRFSSKQLDVLGKYGGCCIPKLAFSSTEEYLEELGKFSPEQLDALSRNATAIFQNIEKPDRVSCLVPLSKFSPEQIDVLGRNAATIFQNIGSYDRVKCLIPLSKFSPEQLDVLGKYGKKLVPKIELLSSAHNAHLELLSSFSAQELEAHTLTDHPTSLSSEEHVNIHYKRGLFCRDHSKQDPGHIEAIRSFARTLELDPTHVRAMHNLAMLYFKLNNSQKAKEWFQKAANLGFQPSQRNLDKMPATD